nr:MAG TPA: hypothetical protein [Bacteriophage sp.]
MFSHNVYIFFVLLACVKYYLIIIFYANIQLIFHITKSYKNKIC